MVTYVYCSTVPVVAEIIASIILLLLFFKPSILAVLSYSVVDPEPVRTETFGRIW
jgi:hypothetical protein